MDDLLEAYLRYLLAERNLSAYTLRNYRSDLSHFFHYLSAEEDINPLRVDRQALRRYLAQLRAASLASASIARKVSTIHSFYKFLLRSGRLSRDLLAGVAAPKRERLLPRFLTQEQLTALIAAADGSSPQGLRDRALLELLYAAGLRVSEVAGLDLGDVYLNERTARVWGKGSKERIVFIGRPAAAALKAYLKTGRPHLAGKQDEKALFLNRDGRRLSPRSVQVIVRKYALRAGLDQRVFPHLLRHSFATHLLDGGAELRVVQELMGHASANTTQIYTHVTEKRQQEVYTQAFYNQVRLKARQKASNETSPHQRPQPQHPG